MAVQCGSTGIGITLIKEKKYLLSISGAGAACSAVAGKSVCKLIYKSPRSRAVGLFGLKVGRSHQKQRLRDEVSKLGSGTSFTAVGGMSTNDVITWHVYKFFKTLLDSYFFIILRETIVTSK